VGIVFGIFLAFIAAIAISAIVASSGPVTQADALQNLINEIDSGPNWETAQDAAAVSGYLKWEETDNGNDGGGACAYANGTSAGAGFACYLYPSALYGSTNYYFSENASGGDIHPISTSQYNQETGLG
jgi:hypothetical protein